LELLAALGDEPDHGNIEAISDSALERMMIRACKNSIKANKILSSIEITALIDALSECSNPFTCPHGRPVFIKLTRSDIERLFKRA